MTDSIIGKTVYFIHNDFIHEGTVVKSGKHSRIIPKGGKGGSFTLDWFKTYRDREEAEKQLLHSRSIILGAEFAEELNQQFPEYIDRSIGKRFQRIETPRHNRDCTHIGFWRDKSHYDFTLCWVKKENLPEALKLLRERRKTNPKQDIRKLLAHLDCHFVFNVDGTMSRS